MCVSERSKRTSLVCSRVRVRGFACARECDACACSLACCMLVCTQFPSFAACCHQDQAAYAYILDRNGVDRTRQTWG